MGLLASMIRTLLALSIIPAAFADVRLPALVSDHMMLQRQAPVRIWGWADPAEKVTVSFRGQKAAATTSSEGKWQVFLQPMSQGAPAEMTIAGKSHGHAARCPGRRSMGGFRSVEHGVRDGQAA